MGVKYAGKRFGTGQNGDWAEVQMYVDAPNMKAALTAPGVPRWGDTFDVNGETEPTLIARTIESGPIDARVDSRQLLIIRYESRSSGGGGGRSLPSTKAYAEWSIGLKQERELLSMVNRPVGSEYFFNADGSTPANLEVDGKADLGYDRPVPTLEVAIRIPSTTAWAPLTVLGLTGCVNAAAYSIEGTTFPPGLLMFLGGEARRTGPLAANYEVFYRFMCGYKVVSDNTPLFVEDTDATYDPGTARILPLQYGTWTRYKKVDVGDDSYRIPVALSVFRALPVKSFVPIAVNWS